MIMEPLAGIVTLAMGGLLGYALSSRIPAPRRVLDVVGWGLAVLVAAYMGRDTRVVSAFGFAIFANNLLMSLILGALLGVFIRNQARPAHR